MGNTERHFNDMLNEYLAYDLLKGEYLQRDWLMSNIDKDLKWLSGDVIVPFKGAQASSIKFGGLTAANDISRYKYVRGKITTQPEAWASLIFDHKDLMEHGKISEQNFLKMLPDQIDEMMNYFKMVMSVSLLKGNFFALATDTTNAATGKIVVDRIDLFELGQKCQINKGANQLSVYVIAIDINTNEVTFSATRDGAFVDLSATYTNPGVKFAYDGILVGGSPTNQFTSMPSILLSAVNGGDTNYLGYAKTAYPYLQCVNIDGSSISASNILAKLFEAYTTVKVKARGNADRFIMSYKHLGSCMASLETEKGPFKVDAQQTKVTKYGWTEITVMSINGKGTLKIVGIQEMADDIIIALDMSTWKFHSNGLFQKRISPDGNQFYEVRNETGYQYISDVSVNGQIACRAPDQNGIIYGINY